MDRMENMYDLRLKPRLLLSVIRDRLPDEKHPLPDPSQLSSLLSLVRIHGLLKESVHGTKTDKKLIQEWKYAVDSWVDHVFSLASSNMPDKRWIGVGLLGLTCEECHSYRFVAFYSDWVHKILEIIQLPGGSYFTAVAACSSLSDLLIRLSEFTHLKKDAASLAGKIIQPILQMLNEDASDALWVAAVDLLCNVTTFFPFTVRRHYDKVEATIVSKIMSGKYTMHLSKELARCLALLPKACSDDSTWSLMMQKVLISINKLLDEAFEGLKEGVGSSEIMRLLVPPGEEPPSPLGGHLVLEESITKKLQDLLVPRVSTLMQCAFMLLTTPYPIQVTVPIYSLLAVAERVLMVDGSLPDSSITSALHQEILCSELPVLHLGSLDLLTAIIEGIGSQLIPHAAKIVNLLKQYMERAIFPSTRIKVYAMMRVMLMSMGAGMAQYLSKEIVENAFSDLGYSNYGLGMLSANKGGCKFDNGFLCLSNSKKRKHSEDVELPNEPQNLSEKHTARPVQLAALQALEALLTVGGSFSSESWRLNVDLLLVSVATKASDAVFHDSNVALTEEPFDTHTDLQLAALRALFKSLLSPGRARPPYLSQGLEIFRRGKRKTGTKVGAFCVDALLALEVLIHPRALPVTDFQVFQSPTFNGTHDNAFTNTQHSLLSHEPWVIRNNDLNVDDDDDFWLGNGKGNEMTDDIKDSHVQDIEEPSSVPSGKTMHEGSKNHTPNVEMAIEGRDRNASDNLQKMELQACDDTTSTEDNGDVALTPGGIDDETSIPIPTNGIVMVSSRRETVSSSEDSVIPRDSNVDAKFSATVTHIEEERLDYDSDSPSLDLIPPIVNIEPDSD